MVRINNTVHPASSNIGIINHAFRHLGKITINDMKKKGPLAGRKD
jgi:hypothetical protein